jgi:hypothetical protein
VIRVPIPARLVSRFLKLTFGVICILFAAEGSGFTRAPQSVVLAAGTYAFGAENSWIRVQNIGNANANVEVDYFDESGRIAGKDTCPSPSCPALFPGSGWTFFQKDNPGLPAGFQGSAIVSTDQPIVAIMAKDVTRGSSFAIAGDTVTTGPGSHRLYIPITAKRDGAQRDWNGRFAIQNMSDTVTACVTITYLSNYTDGEVAWEPYKAGASGVARLPGCPNGGMPLPPRGTIFRDPDTMPVSEGFTGSVRIDLSKNAANEGPDKQFISATADTWNRLYASFGSYRAMDEGELGTDIILPLIDRQVGPGNSYSTHFQIENKDPTKPAHVSLRFDGFDLSGNFVSKTNNLTIRGARLCFQDRDDYANCLQDGDKLPFNFIGTVRLISDQPIGVIVNRSTSLNDTFTNYRGIRPQDGANRVLLPNLNKNYGPVPGVAAGWNSWFRVMVADGGRANVTVRYFGLDLPGGSVSYTLSVDREFTVFQYLEAMLPNGFAGTAIIEADRPIVALANLTTDVFRGDPDFLYNGISLDR